MEEAPLSLWSLGSVEKEDVIVLKYVIQTGGGNSSISRVRIRNLKSAQADIELRCLGPAEISGGWDIPICVHSARD